MKLIIDIPEVVKHKIYAYGLSLSPSDKEQLIHAIMNGTPLPKGHGRLIDISEYEKYFNTEITYDDGNHIHSVYTNTISTIIEADTEGSDKE